MKIVKLQKLSRTCFICGTTNPFGLKTRFYELENQTLLSIATGAEEHNSYPDRMHGGIISALLDEGIGRAINISEPDTFGVTTNLTIKYLKPVPLNVEIYGIYKITNHNRFLFSGVGLLCDKDGTILAKGEAKYMKLPPQQISTSEFLDETNWFDDPQITDPKTIDLPLTLWEELK